MIVNHKYKFIFLKTSKTAGTSIEIALSKHCSDNDIVTLIPDVDEQLRVESGGQPGQEYLAPFREYGPQDWYRYLVNKKIKKRFYNHIPARKAKPRLGRDIWDNYFKFCVERNPWDRVVSQYHWRYRNIDPGERPSLDEFLSSSHVRSLHRKGYQIYTINNRIVMDHVCRYETLNDDLEHVRQILGIPESLSLPMAKSGHRKDRRHYTDVLTAEQRDRIGRIFRKEINFMGYQF